MKKFLAIFLALIAVLSVSLVACGRGNDNPDETTTEPGDIWTGDVTTTTGGVDNSTTTTQPPVNLTWTDDGNTVYVIDCYQCQIRTSDVVNSSNIAGTASFGQSFTRVKYNDEWSVILVDGAERYIKTKYVTSDPGYVVYTDKEATVYCIAEETLNLRWFYFGVTDEEIASGIAFIVERGNELKQTGVSQNGKWIRLEYNGATVYCNASLVSTTPPAEGSDGTTAAPGPATPPVVG